MAHYLPAILIEQRIIHEALQDSLQLAVSLHQASGRAMPQRLDTLRKAPGRTSSVQCWVSDRRRCCRTGRSSCEAPGAAGARCVARRL